MSAKTQHEIERLRAALSEIRDLIDGRIDVEDGDEGKQRPNIFMRIADVCDTQSGHEPTQIGDTNCGGQQDAEDAARFRKLCGLLGYGECVIEREVAPDDAYQQFDYSDELIDWIDTASDAKSKAGHQDEERHGRGIGCRTVHARGGG